MIEVLDTDITRLEVDAIANAANTELSHAGGVAAAISARGRSGGAARVDAPGADRAWRGRRDHGAATARTWVIHAATMELGGPTSAEIIRAATASTLRRADGSARARWRSSPSAPASAASRSTRRRAIEVDEVRRHLAEARTLERVVFAVRGAEAARAFQAALSSGA